MNKIRSTKGITLVALIITIIILVILAAVSIAAVYNSRIVEKATIGSYNYANQSLRENSIMEGTTSLVDSTLDEIEDILAGKGLPSGTPGGGTDTPVGEGKTPEELETMIGKYVDYQPDGTTYKVDKYYSQRSWQ